MLRALLLTALAASSAHATTVRIHYDANDTVSIRADKGPMSWSQGVPAKR